MWALRRIKRIKGEQQFGTRMNEILGHIGKVLVEGNPKAIREIRPVILAILQAALQHHTLEGQLDVKLTKMAQVRLKSKHA